MVKYYLLDFDCIDFLFQNENESELNKLLGLIPKERREGVLASNGEKRKREHLLVGIILLKAYQDWMDKKKNFFEEGKVEIDRSKLLEMEASSISFAWKIEKAEGGKPYLVGLDLSFSISHSDGLCVIAFSDKEIGIDLQLKKEYLKKIADRFFARKEVETIEMIEAQADEDTRADAFYRLWTAKESYGKLLGTGVVDSLNKDFSLLIKKNYNGFENECIIEIDNAKYRFEFEVLGNNNSVYYLSTCNRPMQP